MEGGTSGGSWSAFALYSTSSRLSDRVVTRTGLDLLSCRSSSSTGEWSKCEERLRCRDSATLRFLMELRILLSAARMSAAKKRSRKRGGGGFRLSTRVGLDFLSSHVSSPTEGWSQERLRRRGSAEAIRFFMEPLILLVVEKERSS